MRNISPRTKYLPIGDDNLDMWASYILNLKIEERLADNQEIQQNIDNQCFNIKVNAGKLEELYKKLYKELTNE